MDALKISRIIERENEKREYEATQRAAEIINNISNKHAAIAKANADIAKLREELKALRVTTLDQAQILGQ